MTTSSSHSQPHPAQEHRTRRRPRHVLRARPALIPAALILATALALNACAPPDTPPNPATTTTAMTTTPAKTAPTPAATSPTPSPAYKPATANGPAQNVPIPVLPAKAKEFSKAGLEAFATYWYTTLGYAFETGDAKPMMAITDPACETCERIKEPVGRWYEPGGWIAGGRMTVHSAATSFVKAPDGMFQVVLMTQQSPTSYYNPDKSLKKAYPPATAQADILIASYERGQWTAHTVEKLTGVS